ncbi:MAG TPA: MCP four helix bundle domain-containing protein [Tenuifilaceae bacterium]|nr:MCP four helix bundle domain-containing protein [Tenuifilaceae bacterium]
MSIRLKILSGFIILASLLIISGLISIYELTKLGNSVNKLLRDNYLSIDYARQMSHSLEKQNSAIQFWHILCSL